LDAAKEEIENILICGQQIWTVEQVVSSVYTRKGIEISKVLVRQLLKDHFEMTYRKIKRAAF
jgi:transposase